VVTGGTRGLGYALSLELGAKNYRVIAIYHADAHAAAVVQRAFFERGMNCTCVQADLTTIDTLDLPFDAAVEELVLVHNAAASFEPRPLHLSPLDDLHRQWAVAARGFLLCAQAMLRPMARVRRSTVVAVTSRVLGKTPAKGFGAYSAAKSALASLTQSVAVEYGGRGTRVFTVSPGFMRTSLTDGWDPTIREAVARAGESTTATVARSIVALIEDPSLPACGESYDV
jgi:NAD(P)-dependent dehydrogenase (short-subunit alcohol dehydrogenase family)